MTRQAKNVLSVILRLAPIERAEMLELILSSFNFNQRKKIDAVWKKEAEQRLASFKSGGLKAIPINEVFEKIKG